MVRGLYTAGTGMLVQRRKMETVTNNITNAETNSYKKEYMLSHSFDKVLARRINDTNVLSASGRAVGPLNFGTQVDHLYINFDQGSLDGTERSTDLALIGDVFFVVQTADGERYTRDGSFHINPQDILQTAQETSC